LPDDASDFNCDIAEKSFVNDEALSEGADPLDELLDEPLPLLAELLELDELPHAATTRPRPKASTTTDNLLFSKCMRSPLS
jgi:hypothetical protein